MGGSTVSKQSRAFVAAVQVSLDGYMPGANGEVDWVDSWSDALDLIPGADAAVVGGGMWPGYEQLWGSIAADPRSGKAMLGREVAEGGKGEARVGRQGEDAAEAGRKARIGDGAARLHGVGEAAVEEHHLPGPRPEAVEGRDEPVVEP